MTSFSDYTLLSYLNFFNPVVYCIYINQMKNKLPRYNLQMPFICVSQIYQLITLLIFESSFFMLRKGVMMLH